MARQSKGITLPIIYKADLGGLKKAGSALEGFGRLAGQIGLAAGAALAGVVVSGVKMATDLETTFSQIQGLVGLSAGEVNELKDAAKTLGPEFGKSAQEAADALFFITSSGLRGADAIDTLEAALKGSAVGLGDVNALANAATAAMNTYGPEVLSGAAAVDALAEAVRLGQFAPEELAGSLGRVIPMSNELGVSFQETTGLIAALTRGGLNASESVTGVRGAMQAFIKPSAEAERVLADFGMSVDDVRESIRNKGFLNTLVDMRDRFGDNEDAITDVFGSVEGLNAVFGLTGDQLGTNIDIINQMTDDLGILDEAFGITEDTVGFKTAQAFETFKGILLEIGDAVLPLVADLLDEFGPIIKDAADAVVAFIDTELGPFIEGLKANEEFQTFLTTVKDLFLETAPKVAEFASNVFILAGNLFTLLKPALDQFIGEDGVLVSFTSILDDVNYFLGELNEFKVPGFHQGLVDLFEPVDRILNPLGNLDSTLRGVARAFDAAREAWEKWKASGFSMSRLEKFNKGGVLPGSVGPTRAAGGSVMGGNSYLVGERGPEVFVPSMSGQIIPNHRLGGGSSVNIVVNAGMGANGSEIGREIVSAIRRYERTSGKVFANA